MVVTQNPGGTGNCAPVSSPRLAALPPILGSLPAHNYRCRLGSASLPSPMLRLQRKLTCKVFWIHTLLGKVEGLRSWGGWQIWRRLHVPACLPRPCPKRLLLPSPKRMAFWALENLSL